MTETTGLHIHRYICPTCSRHTGSSHGKVLPHHRYDRLPARVLCPESGLHAETGQLPTERR